MSKRPVPPDAMPSPAPAPGADSRPASSPGPGDAALWGDSDAPDRLAGDFSGLVATPPVPRVMATIGHVGRYALKYQLGAGGVGTVFAAHDPLLSRLIAVKTLHVEVSEAERQSFNTLFINEARAAGGLSHPHIVTVFDAGISDDRAYIAMELLKGRDLRQLREEGWRPTPAQAALIVRRVADALAFAHSRGVIHRDIKPANIFMVGRTQPRVLDFGIASIAHRRDEDDALRGAGSPFYMAPEQIRNETVDRRADVFSLGVVFYELLADCKPFTGGNLEQIRQAVLTHEPPSAHKVDRAVPKALAEIAARAMAKDPERRFRSTRSFARELRQWLDENPAARASDAPVEPPSRRHSLRLWSAAGAAALAALAIAAAVFVRNPSVDPAPAASASSGVDAQPVQAQAAVDAIDAQASVAPAAGSASATASAASAAAAEASIPALPAIGADADTDTVRASASILLPSEPAATQPTRAPTTREVTRDAIKDAARDKRLRDAAQARERELRERRGREAVEAREALERRTRLAAAPSTPPPAAPPTTGTLKIAVSPWGQVEVDGAGVGVAPPLTELTLAEGRHRIVVRNGDFAPYAATVDVAAGRIATLRYKFGGP